jgi:hypothetical protein
VSRSRRILQLLIEFDDLIVIIALKIASFSVFLA